MKRAIALLIALSACRREPHPLADLAAHLPANSQVLAGLDVDRLRDTLLFAQLPESFREASYVLAAYDPPNLVTASRVAGRVVATNPATNAPPDLIRHAADAPIWIVVRGNATLPLAGNLANLNRLLQQTLYTRVTARVAAQVDFAAEAVCATPESAEHLEQNIRALATLAKIPLEVRRDRSTVHVTGSTSTDVLSNLF